MELASLLCLPCEILHNISTHLSAEDILNCSLTCHYLRAVFNDDFVWKRFLTENICQLDKQEEILEPTFDKKQKSLTPLCENRILYTKRCQLLKNWSNAKFSKYTSSTHHCYASGVFNKPKGRGLNIYKERYIFLGRFINDIHSDGIEVWDIGKEPVVHSFLPIENIEYDSFFLVGSNLVVIECVIIKVYEITIPEKIFPLLYSFKLTDSDVSWGLETRHSGRCNFDCVGWSNYNVDHYLVSNKCGDEGSVIHVWDIINGTHTGTFVAPFNGFSVVVQSHNGNEWFLRGNFQTGGCCIYFLFDIGEKTFSDTVFSYEQYPKYTIFYKYHILFFTDVQIPNSQGWHDSICTVYDFDTSKEIKKRRFNNAKKNFELGSTTIVNGKFIILCFDCFKIIDALTLETVDYFQFDLTLKFITHQFNLFGSTFVVAAGEDCLLYMWDVKNKKKLQRSLEVVYTSQLYLNHTMTKMVTFDYYKLNVLHFW